MIYVLKAATIMSETTSQVQLATKSTPQNVDNNLRKGIVPPVSDNDTGTIRRESNAEGFVVRISRTQYVLDIALNAKLMAEQSEIESKNREISRLIK